MYKRGQAEHIFSDLIPAVIILIITLIFINFVYNAEETTLEKIEKTSMENEKDIILVNYVRAPLENHPVGLENAESFIVYLKDKELNFADLIRLTQTSNDEIYKLFLRERTKSFFNNIYGRWSIRINENQIIETNTKPEFISYSSINLPSENGIIKVELAVWET